MSSVKKDQNQRFDNKSHWAVHYQKVIRSRCKMLNCSCFTPYYCSKCEIHLCFTPKRNCFFSFHNSPTESNETKQQPIEEKLTIEENVQIGLDVIETKERCRKKNSSTVENGDSNAVKAEKSDDPIKKPRKRKCVDSSSKCDQTVKQQPKPKRRRTTKENTIQSELMSLPILFDTGKFQQ